MAPLANLKAAVSHRFGLMLRRLLPIFPDKRTSRTETSRSEECQQPALSVRLNLPLLAR